MNGVRVLLRLHCMLLGYSFKPRPNSSVVTIGLSINEWMLPQEKPVTQEKTRKTRVDIQAAANFRGFTRFRQNLIFVSLIKKKTKGGGSAPTQPGYSTPTIHTMYWSSLCCSLLLGCLTCGGSGCGHTRG